MYNPDFVCRPGERRMQCCRSACQKWYCGAPSRVFCSQECGYLNQIEKTSKELANAGKPSKLTIEQMRTALECYKSGMILTNLMKKLHLRIESISDFLFDPIVMERFNVVKRRKSRPHLTPEEMLAVHRALKEGMTHAQAAAAFDISRASVNRSRLFGLEQEKPAVQPPSAPLPTQRAVPQVSKTMKFEPYVPNKDIAVPGALSDNPMPHVFKSIEQQNMEAYRKLDKPMEKKSVFRRILNFMGLDYYENRRVQSKP